MPVLRGTPKSPIGPQPGVRPRGSRRRARWQGRTGVAVLQRAVVRHCSSAVGRRARAVVSFGGQEAVEATGRYRTGPAPSFAAVG